MGGPQPKEKIPKILETQLRCVSSGKGWVFKIISKLHQEAVGTICIFGGFYKDEEITEIGWGVAPKFQRNGYGTKAVAQILSKVKETGRWTTIHAFTSTTNEPSNAICRKVGFNLIEECDIDYDDRVIHSNHWIFDGGLL